MSTMTLVPMKAAFFKHPMAHIRAKREQTRQARAREVFFRKIRLFGKVLARQERLEMVFELERMHSYGDESYVPAYKKKDIKKAGKIAKYMSLLPEISAMREKHIEYLSNSAKKTKKEMLIYGVALLACGAYLLTTVPPAGIVALAVGTAGIIFTLLIQPINRAMVKNVPAVDSTDEVLNSAKAITDEVSKEAGR